MQIMAKPHIADDVDADPILLIVDDHELVRLGMSTLVTTRLRCTDMTVQTLEAGTLQQALQLFAKHQSRISLVLLDLHLPDTHGLSGLRDFLARFPKAPIAVLSANSDSALMRQALNAGARAYFSKAAQLTDVIAYLRANGLMGAGDAAQAQPESGDQPVASSAYRHVRTVQTHDGERISLTQRQAQMLDWLLVGYSNREIAAHAHLSEGTVKNHVSALLLMFGVRSRAQLISRLR